MKRVDIELEEVRRRGELWDETEYFCPGCSARQVWSNIDEGHLCLGCGSGWRIDGLCLDEGDEDAQRLVRLRRAANIAP